MGENEKPKFSEDEEQLLHTIYSHIIEGSFAHLAIAIEELYANSDDERVKKLREQLEPLAEQIMEVANDALDGIPGLMSREEAEAKVIEMLKRVALTNGLPPEILKPEGTILH